MMLEHLFAHDHNGVLVTIAFAIAVLASYTVLDMAGRVSVSRGLSRIRWLAGGAIAMGTGIWSMHFTAMLAFRAPVPVQYDAIIVLISWVIAIVPSGLALHTASRTNPSWTRLVSSGVMMGLTIGAMHYVGMEAMLLAARVTYDVSTVVASIAIAMVASIVALWLSLQFRERTTTGVDWPKVASAVVMGVAISGMHHVGMNAAVITPNPAIQPDYSHAIDISLIGAGAIITVTLLILSFSLVVSFIDKLLNLKESDLARSQVALEESHKKLERHVSELELVRDLTRLTTTFLNRESLISAAAHQVAESYDGAHVLLYLVEDGVEEMTLGGHDGPLPDVLPEALTTHLLNSGPVGRAAALGQSHFNPAVERPDDGLFPKTQAEVIVPIRNSDRVLGVLVVKDTHRDRLTEHDLDLMQVIADQIAPSLQNAQLFEEAVRSREEARQATRTKSEFLSTMTHELRTPMNGVLGMTSLLLDSNLTAEQKDLVSTIRVSGDALLTIINDILDFSKIEANRIELEQVDFHLGTAIEESMDLISTKAAAKGLNLAYFVEPEVPVVLQQDVTRVRQILTNLLSNAVKFTEEGEISVHTSASQMEDGHFAITFEVRDTGIGIPEERRNRLFRSFSQVDASVTRKFGGTGLGLAISKKLSEVMGGRMWVHSEVGVGSSFFFSILSRAGDLSIVPAFEHVQALSGAKALIAGPYPTNQRIIERYLESWNIESTIDRYDGRGRLEFAPDELAPYDLLIVELRNPTPEDAERLRKVVEPHGDLSVVILSGRGQAFAKEFNGRRVATASVPIRPSYLYDAIVTAHAGTTPERRPQRTRVAAGFNKNLANESPLRILLAEDNIVNQKVALGMLSKLGYEADVAANGIEALEAVHRRTYDLILMDVNMPEMDGVEATREIKALPERLGVPRIVGLTANAMQEDRDEYIKAGMDDCITKPVVREILERTLREASALRKTVDAESEAVETDCEAIGAPTEPAAHTVSSVPPAESKAKEIVH